MDEREPKIGDLIIVGGNVVKITSITDFTPGSHAASPVRDDMPARRYRTGWGDRWSGVREDGTAYAPPLMWCLPCGMAHL